jgi:hypothetical protein
MSKRTYAVVLVAAALLILVAIAMRGQGTERLAGWLPRIHGR